ncbi:MAG TPA: hypothetical protein DGT21_06110 [Armatimonadetes bacterium]|nr:hypothetical protein [Armatimonadota bacterium]
MTLTDLSFEPLVLLTMRALLLAALSATGVPSDDAYSGSHPWILLAHAYAMAWAPSVALGVESRLFLSPAWAPVVSALAWPAALIWCVLAAAVVTVRALCSHAGRLVLWRVVRRLLTEYAAFWGAVIAGIVTFGILLLCDLLLALCAIVLVLATASAIGLCLAVQQCCRVVRDWLTRRRAALAAPLPLECAHLLVQLSRLQTDKGAAALLHQVRAEGRLHVTSSSLPTLTQLARVLEMPSQLRLNRGSARLATRLRASGLSPSEVDQVIQWVEARDGRTLDVSEELAMLIDQVRAKLAGT